MKRYSFLISGFPIAYRLRTVSIVRSSPSNDMEISATYSLASSHSNPRIESMASLIADILDSESEFSSRSRIIFLLTRSISSEAEAMLFKRSCALDSSSLRRLARSLRSFSKGTMLSEYILDEEAFCISPSRRFAMSR